MFDMYGKQNVTLTSSMGGGAFTSLADSLSTRKSPQVRRQFSVVFKRGVVLTYLHTKLTADQVSAEFELGSKQLVYKWTKQFKQGHLEVGNAIAVSRAPTGVRR